MYSLSRGSKGNKTVKQRPEERRAHDTKEHLEGMIILKLVSNTEDVGGVDWTKLAQDMIRSDL